MWPILYTIDPGTQAIANTQGNKKKTKKNLQQANSVYNLPSAEEAIKWMHAVCGYPFKSTCIKAIKLGKCIVCPNLNEHNVEKYTQKPPRRQRDM